MGALFLDVLDKRMESTGLFYVRFMDDWVVLAPSRWKLRRAVALVNQTLAELQVEQHPDKTFIGQIEREFAFLGYRMNAAGLTGVATPTWERFLERVNRLYEQGALTCLGEYVRRWLVWVKSGISDLVSIVLGVSAQRSVIRRDHGHSGDARTPKTLQVTKGWI